MEATMKKTLIRAALGATVLAGATLAAAPADARVSVGIGIGVPGYYGGYADPCYRPYPYPEYCGYPVYSGPVFIGGAWHTGAWRYRFVNGHRAFWWRGGWHGGHWGHGGHWYGPRHGGWHGHAWHGSHGWHGHHGRH
jgi:hypothetical protein